MRAPDAYSISGVTSEVSTSGAEGETKTAEAESLVARIGPPLVVGSVLGSTLGIVVAQFLDDLGDGLLARVLGGEAVIYNNRVEVVGVTNDLVWGGGFLLCLVIGFLALFFYPTQREQGIPRLVLLWVLLHVLRQALIQPVLIPFDGGSRLARAYATLELPPGLDLVIAAAGGVALLLIGLSAASAFLAFTPHRRLINGAKKRLSFVLWLTLIPAAASVFLAIPFFLPDSESLVIRLLPLTTVMFLATVAAAPGTTTVAGPDEENRPSWPWSLAITLVLLLVLYQAVFQGGVNLDPRLWG